MEWFKASTAQQHVVEQYVMLIKSSTRTVCVCAVLQQRKELSMEQYSNTDCLIVVGNMVAKSWSG